MYFYLIKLAILCSIQNCSTYDWENGYDSLNGKLNCSLGLEMGNNSINALVQRWLDIVLQCSLSSTYWWSFAPLWMFAQIFPFSIVYLRKSNQKSLIKRKLIFKKLLWSFINDGYVFEEVLWIMIRNRFHFKVEAKLRGPWIVIVNIICGRPLKQKFELMKIKLPEKCGFVNWNIQWKLEIVVFFFPH